MALLTICDVCSSPLGKRTTNHVDHGTEFDPEASARSNGAKTDVTLPPVRIKVGEGLNVCQACAFETALCALGMPYPDARALVAERLRARAE